MFLQYWVVCDRWVHFYIDKKLSIFSKFFSISMKVYSMKSSSFVRYFKTVVDKVG